MNFLALDQYSASDIKKIVDISAIDGVVLGDMFCNKRMFEFGDSELVELTKLANDLGLASIFQTPRYLTERCFDRIMQQISYFISKHYVCAVIAQDIGAVSYLHKSFPDLRIIWGHIGVPRNGANNLLHYSFLRQLGVTDIETDCASRIPYILDIGLNAFLMGERITYNSVNRECYFEHELGIYDGNCGRRCLTEKLKLKNEAYGFDFPVNGYTLGLKYSPLANEQDAVCDIDRIYRESDLQEFLKRTVVC